MQFADISALLLITSDIDIIITTSTLSNIDSWNTEAILVVETSGSITAEGLVIQDCSAAEYLISFTALANPGGQVASASSVTVQDSVFTGQQPSVLIDSFSTFISNSTFWGAGVPFGLAAVVNVTSQTNIQIAASNFFNLTTSAAAYAAVALQGDIVGISNSRFIGNKGAHGAVRVGANASAILESYFEANQASNGGGAAYVQSAVATISDCQFTNNSALSGGAVSVYSERVIIMGCLFDANNAWEEENDLPSGGAVSLMAALKGSEVSVEVESNHSISNSWFFDNYAFHGGGGIEARSIANVDINNCTFYRSVGVWGGAIRATAVVNVLLQNSLITRSSGNVGVFFTGCSCVGVINSIFTNASGTGLYLFDQSQDGHCEDLDPFGNNMFSRNSIADTEDETALIEHWFSESYKQVTVAIRNSQFTHHTLRDRDRILARNGATAALSIAGGASGGVLLADVLFENNDGTANDGAAFSHSFSSKTVIWGCTFTNNTAQSGAALHALKVRPSGGFLIGNTTMTGNLADTGGAVYGDSAMEFYIINSIFFNNTAISFGGALYCDTCIYLGLFGGTISRNHAGSDGGGIYCDRCVKVDVSEVALTFNRCASGSVILLL